MAHVQRLDHVGITVADLSSVTAFFVRLGLEVEGNGSVEGEFVETVCGIPPPIRHSDSGDDVPIWAAEGQSAVLPPLPVGPFHRSNLNRGHCQTEHVAFDRRPVRPAR